MISTLTLQKGSPFDVGICKVYPLTLGEIEQLGEVEYNQYLYYLFLDKSLFDTQQQSEEEIKLINQMTTYDVMLYYSYHVEGVKDIISKALSTFIKEKVNYYPFDGGYFYVGDNEFERIITHEHYETIKLVLQKQNYLQDKKEEVEFKPANDKAAELIEKMKQMKDKLKKQNSEEGLHLSDIISIVANYSNDINILTVWNLNVYQLHETLVRISMWDDYHDKRMILPHMDENGRKSLDLKHWATKINYTQV
jgi:hypothetical protein